MFVLFWARLVLRALCLPLAARCCFGSVLVFFAFCGCAVAVAFSCCSAVVAFCVGSAVVGCGWLCCAAFWSSLACGSSLRCRCRFVAWLSWCCCLRSLLFWRSVLFWRSSAASFCCSFGAFRSSCGAALPAVTVAFFFVRVGEEGIAHGLRVPRTPLRGTDRAQAVWSFGQLAKATARPISKS